MNMKTAPQVIILAAGEGSRLRPYTNDRPKCLVEVAGSSLLDRQLKVLRSQGLEDIGVIAGYRGEQLKGRGLRVYNNPHYAQTNMVWTLFCAEQSLDRETIIAYGDIVYSSHNLRALLNSKADIAVVIDRQWESYWRARFGNPLDDAETLKLDGNGCITEIGQKPTSLYDIQGQYIGLMKFSAHGVEQLRQRFHAARQSGEIRGKTLEKAYMTDMLQLLIDTGCRVEAVPVDGEWVEVDNATDLALTVTRERLETIAAE
ncbi:MAG TPA: phosphocholine cytidylyltransferase family protein [Rhodocyclaceae bacterium]|jgi:choline kinase